MEPRGIKLTSAEKHVPRPLSPWAVLLSKIWQWLSVIWIIWIWLSHCHLLHYTNQGKNNNPTSCASSTPPFWPLKVLSMITIPVVFDQPLSRINRIQMHLALIQFASALSCLSFAVSKVTSETHGIRSSFILWKISVLQIFLSFGLHFLFAVFSYKPTLLKCYIFQLQICLTWVKLKCGQLHGYSN